jgi:hypothetical protein
MWSAYTKYIRTQVNKDRLVDTLLFGHVFKKSEDDLAATSQYCYAIDGKRSNAFGDFKLMIGTENFSGIPRSHTDGKESVQANMNGIARVCNCSVDQVLQFL